MKRAASDLINLEGGPKEWAEQVIHRKYFPHVDGLRCLAVVPVVFFHLASWICPGGFVGVDIFFVISGYLIYGGILDDLQKGTFSMSSFYHRRIRRIFPAYFIVVYCTLLAGIVLYHWARLVPLAQTALFSTFFSTNIYFWLDMGYFQPDANANALLHLWTLGVEEQFYIVVPLLSLALWKISRTSLKPALYLLTFASLVLCVVLGEKGISTTAFYILPTRAWELLAGALIADLPQAQKSLRAGLLALLGLALILLPFWCFSTARTFENFGTSVELILPFFGSVGIFPFPGIAIIPVIVGSLLLLRYGNTGPVAQVLCHPLFTGIGKISYSLYLWHWPIIVFARYIAYDHQSDVALTVVFLLSFLAAYLSWRWVEMPVRVNKGFTPRFAFATIGYGSTLLVATCLLLIFTDGLRAFIHTKANYYAVAPRSFLLNFEKFTPRPPFRPPAYPLVDETYLERIGQADQKPSFCLLGDSHAEALAPGLDRVAKEYHRAGFYLTVRMPPYVSEGSTATPQKLIEWVGANPDIHDVYLVGRWLEEYRNKDGLPKLGDKGHIKPVVLDPKVDQDVENNFRRTAQWFIAHGKRVFVFTDVPDYIYAPADLMARSQIIPLPYPIDVTREDYDNRQQAINRILAKLESEGLLTVIPLGSALVSDNQTVFMSPEGKPYYKDHDHLTEEGAYFVSRAIAPLLWPGLAPEKDENPKKMQP